MATLKKMTPALFAISLLLVLYQISEVNYLLFHGIVEVASIAVALALFMLVWNAKKYLDNGYLLFIGIAYFFVALIDLIHTFAYKGMGVFPAYDANLPTQLWIAARALQASALLISPLFLRRKLNPATTLTFFTVVTTLLFLSIFRWGIFPDCYIEGSGLTPFKRISEYLISLMLMAAILLLILDKARFEKKVLHLMILSIAATIIAELAFTFYISVYGLSNFIGHIFKLVAFIFLYRTIVQTGIEKPQDLIFRELTLTQEAMRQGEEQYRNLVDLMRSGLAVWALSEKEDAFILRSINTGGAQILGREAGDAVGRNLREIFGDPLTQLLEPDLRRVHENGQSIAKPAFACEIDGSPLYLESYIYQIPSGEVAIVFSDVSERVKGEQAIQRAMKMESLLILAGGIAHEFNNTLTALLLQVDLLELRIKRGESPEKNLAQIEDLIEKMQKTTQKMLDYSLGGQFAYKDVDITDIIINSQTYYNSLIKEGYIVELDLSESLPPVVGNAEQLQQAVVNLVTNALESYGDSKNGVVKISTRTENVSAAPDAYPMSETRPEGTCVVVEIEDQGHGISEEITDRLFDPFFSTKFTGRGLGLPVTQSIIKAHNGDITITSAPGTGTTVRVLLPIAENASTSSHRKNNDEF